MFINLISTNNYNQFNIKIAQMLGLHEAIYLNEIININDKAIRKNKIKDGFFNVDRAYITKRTTLSADEQNQIEECLEKLNIIKTSGIKDVISIDLDKIASYLTDESASNIKERLKEIKEVKKFDKKIFIRNQLKNHIKTDNTELRASYCSWIDSVFEKFGYMSKEAVVKGQDVVDAFSKRNLDVALEVISIASVNSYRDMNWAVEAYKRRHGGNVNIIPVITDKSELGTEVF